jgi:hypothetical protein
VNIRTRCACAVIAVFTGATLMPLDVGALDSPGDSRNCGDFTNWREAQTWFETYFPVFGDVARLDADGNLVACESLRGVPAPGTYAPPFPARCRTSGGNPARATPQAPTTSGGYLMLCDDGTVYGFGDLSPIGDDAALGAAVSVAVAPSGGYWVLFSSGAVVGQGVSTFGDPARAALLTGERWTTIAATKSGSGYWVFSNLGRVATFGSAQSFGDLVSRNIRPTGGVIASATTASDGGYFMIGSDGGVFAFGDVSAREKARSALTKTRG